MKMKKFWLGGGRLSRPLIRHCEAFKYRSKEKKKIPPAYSKVYNALKCQLIFFQLDLQDTRKGRQDDGIKFNQSWLSSGEISYSV